MLYHPVVGVSLGVGVGFVGSMHADCYYKNTPNTMSDKKVLRALL